MMMQPVASPAPAAPPPAERPATWRRASGLLWFTFWFLVAGVGVGLAWDRAWHAVHAFDTFYTPPHLLVYSTSILCALLVAYVVFRPALRACFGNAFRIPLFRFPVPGALVILGGGFGTLALAGLLDDIWHTTFGLDETGWSTPHNMIGWGLLIIFLGFVASFLALRGGARLPWYSALLLGYFVLAFSATPFLGPLNTNQTSAVTQLIRTIPVLAAQPAAQHTYRIYLQWNLNRTNPLFIPLSALWLGAAFALMRGIDRRLRIFLPVTLVFWVLQLSSDHAGAIKLDRFIQATTGQPATTALHAANWLPLPIFPLALLLVGLLALRIPERWAWTITGLVMGALSWLIWRDQTLPLVMVLLAGPAMLAGALLGPRVYRILRAPTFGGVSAILLAGVVVPFLFGGIDLYLRSVTP
jgi:hypothetical protein